MSVIMESALTLNKGDQATGATTNLAEGVADTASSSGQSRSSGASNARKTLLGLAGGLLGSIGGLGGGGALEAASSEAESWGAKHRTSERGRHFDEWFFPVGWRGFGRLVRLSTGDGGNWEKLTATQSQLMPMRGVGWKKKVVGIVAGGFQSRRGEDEVMAMGCQACERKKAREESFGRVPTGWELQALATVTRPCDYRQQW